MDTQNNISTAQPLTVGAPIPSDVTIGNMNNNTGNSGSLSLGSPIPSDVTIGPTPAPQTGMQKFTSGLETQTGSDWDSPILGQGLSGAVKSAAGGLGNIIDMLNKSMNPNSGVASPVTQLDKARAQSLADSYKQAHPTATPEQVSQYLNDQSKQGASNYAQEIGDWLRSSGTPQGFWQNVGAIGEQTLEFFGTEGIAKLATVPAKAAEAGKAVQAVDTAAHAAQTAKVATVLQNNPRLAGLVALGLKASKDALAMGAQSYVHTEDAGQAENAALWGGAIGGAASAIGSVASPFLEGMGEDAAKVPELSKVANSAKSKDVIAQELADNLNKAEDQRGADYEKGIDKLKTDLAGQSIPRADSPVATKAQELLSNPNPQVDPLANAANTISGEKLDANTRKLLEQAASGGEEVTPQASSAKYQVDQNGNLVTTPAPTPVFQSHPDWTIDNLIQTRQAIRKAIASYPDYKDGNAYALRQVNNAIDDTIEKLAQNSPNPNAGPEYQNLRAGYKQSLDAFNETVIKNLRDNKLDDAAKSFISGGRTLENVNNLKAALGPEGVKSFSTEVFHNMMQQSTQNGNFNPAAFVRSWNKIPEATRNAFFDMGAYGNALTELKRNAVSAAKLQRLTRDAGFIGLGMTTGPVSHAGLALGGLLGGAVAETGGRLETANKIIDYVTAHPNVFKAYANAGQAAANGTGAVSQTIAQTIARAGNAVTSRPKPKQNNSWTGAVSSNMSK
jgi:hypothetical protein